MKVMSDCGWIFYVPELPVSVLERILTEAEGVKARGIKL